MLTTAMYRQKKTEMKRPLGAVSSVCEGAGEAAGKAGVNAQARLAPS